MAGRYTFFDMLKDVVFNGNKVSGKERNDETAEGGFIVIKDMLYERTLSKPIARS